MPVEEPSTVTTGLRRRPGNKPIRFFPAAPPCAGHAVMLQNGLEDACGTIYLRPRPLLRQRHERPFMICLVSRLHRERALPRHAGGPGRK